MKKEHAGMLAGIALIAVVFIAVEVLAPRHTLPRPDGVVVSDAQTITPPPLTPEIADALKQSPGFQFLVSYTDRGFEPEVATVKKGERVRFVNNSSGKLWIAATAASGALYPGGTVSCGQSSFESCTLLAPGEFWEFTFSAPGTWSYKNNANNARTGVIRVQ